jgi:hypothetical protein
LVRGIITSGSVFPRVEIRGADRGFCMLNPLTSPMIRCGGLSRRRLLEVGCLGTLGLLQLPRRGEARGAAGGSASFGRAQRCLVLFLTGGPPQHETWDPKPLAPAGIRGEMAAIQTNVPGLRFGELFPKLARQADKLCVVRSVTHDDRVHTSAGYTMLTGAYHPLANVETAALIQPTVDDHPHVGALLAMSRPARQGAPTFASLPEIIKDAAVNEFPGQHAGFLGKRYGPFLIDGSPATAAFRLPDIGLPADVSSARLAARRDLGDRVEEAGALRESNPTLADLDSFREQAYSLLTAPAVRDAFDLGREPEGLRQAYGRHLFGQGCLLARRLLEAGVSLVTVYWHYEGPDDSPVWDTHENNFAHLRNRLGPPTDDAVAALLADLSSRGLLEETLVVVMGEFGRSPRVNSKAGRDHWPQVQSILLAGAGVPAGATYGSSDNLGAYPATDPVTPPDLTATLLHLLGAPHDQWVRDRNGRPLRACNGEPIAALVG